MGDSLASEQNKKRALVWIRRDLRLGDHRGLYEATRGFDEVAVCFAQDRIVPGESMCDH